MVITEERKTGLSSKDSFEIAKEYVSLNISDNRFKLKLNKVINELMFFKLRTIDLNNDDFEIKVEQSFDQTSCRYDLMFTIYEPNSLSLVSIIASWLIINDQSFEANSILEKNNISRESYSNLLHALISSEKNSRTITGSFNENKAFWKLANQLSGQSNKSENDWNNKLYIQFEVRNFSVSL